MQLHKRKSLTTKFQSLVSNMQGIIPYIPFDRMTGLRQQFTDNFGASKGVLGI